MTACATETGICLLEFSDRDSLEDEIQKLSDELGCNKSKEENQHLLNAKTELEEYFEEKRTTFAVPIHLHGTSFQKRVWNELQNIPYGKTRTYSEQSINLGDVKAIRAVANANGANRIAILIPCHRIIGSNGDLTGYRGGIHRKKILLQLEQNQSSKVGLNLDLFES